MKWKLIAAMLILFITFLLGTIDSEILHAREYGRQYVDYSYSIEASLSRWIVTSRSDFECSGTAGRMNVNTSVSPGNVMLEKCFPWHSWWNESWGYRMKINISDASTSLSEYQIPIVLNPGNFNYSRTAMNGRDIRFVSNGTLLSYWIEKWNSSGESIIWVKVDSIPAGGTKTIYMYYGNSHASEMSNGSATFLFFDDFEGDEKWFESGLWHTTSSMSYGGGHSKWYGQEMSNNYDTGSANSGELISPAFNLSGNAVLDFRFWREVENLGWSGYDITAVYESADNTTWNEIWYNDSSNPSRREWISLSIPLSPSSRYVRFYFDTVDALYNNYRGWFIDDVRIRKYAAQEPEVDMGAEQSLTSWLDYFGGGADETTHNTTIENGSVILRRYYTSVNIFQDDFEGDLSKWDDNYPTLWYLTTSQSHDGLSSVMADRTNDGALVSDDIDLSSASSAHLTFWFRKSGIEPNDFRLYFYDGSTYHLISRLDLLGPDNTWILYSTAIDMATYGIQNFRIAFYASLAGGERVWVDNLTVTANLSFYCSNGSIISSIIHPENISSWRMFHAHSYVPANTSIVYRIINASSGDVICSINASQAEMGYNVSSHLEGMEAIRIMAEMNTSTSLSPIIYSWDISWKVGYHKQGYIISCEHDAGISPDYVRVEWNATLPSATTIKFQISTSDDGITWSDFAGPDGSNSTFYTTSGSEIWSGHDGRRYIKFIAYLETGDTSVTPVLHDVTLSYYGG